MSSPISKRRQSAALKVAERRISSIAAPVNLKALLRIFLLDGSSKTLQLFESSTALDVLSQLRFNLDLQDISTFALFSVRGTQMRMIGLNEKLSEFYLKPQSAAAAAGEIKILFRSWIHIRYGIFDKLLFQEEERLKKPNAEVWLAYMEATFMLMSQKYYLSEDESMMLGCLKFQAEAGDYNPSVHNDIAIMDRVADRFPYPVCDKMRGHGALAQVRGDRTPVEELTDRVKQCYARLAGKSKTEAQLDFLRLLRIFCPFYGASYYRIQCNLKGMIPNKHGALEIEAAVGPLAIQLVTSTKPVIILRHPYSRIVRWQAVLVDNTFSYWVLKSKDTNLESIRALQEQLGSAFDINEHCDHVVLGSEQVQEIEHVVRSYVEYNNNGTLPHLPGAPGHLKAEEEEDEEGDEDEEDGEGSEADRRKDDSNKNGNGPIRRSSIGALLSGLKGFRSPPPPSAATTVISKTNDQQTLVGSGLSRAQRNGAASDSSNAHKDDTAAVAHSSFLGLYARGNPATSSTTTAAAALMSEQDAMNLLPPRTQLAGDMSELKRLAEENAFSDDSSDSDGDDDSCGSDRDGNTNKSINSDRNGNGNSNKSAVLLQEEGRKQAPSRTSVMLRRASAMLMGAVSVVAPTKKKSRDGAAADENDEGEGEGEDEDEVSSAPVGNNTSTLIPSSRLSDDDEDDENDEDDGSSTDSGGPTTTRNKVTQKFANVDSDLQIAISKVSVSPAQQQRKGNLNAQSSDDDDDSSVGAQSDSGSDSS